MLCEVSGFLYDGDRMVCGYWLFVPRPEAACRSEYDIDSVWLKVIRMTAWKQLTTISLEPLGKVARSWQCARACFHSNLRPVCFNL